jgi:predicted nicotinamide N-methyase
MSGGNGAGPGPELDLVLTDIAVAWVRAAMRSVDPAVVRPKDWWERARTSLVTAAAVADTWPQMVARHLGKLQVRATAAVTATAVEVLGAQLVELGEHAWPRFRALCERDALYIVAMAQAESARRKDEAHG